MAFDPTNAAAWQQVFLHSTVSYVGRLHSGGIPIWVQKLLESAKRHISACLLVARCAHCPSLLTKDLSEMPAAKLLCLQGHSHCREALFLFA